MKTVKESSECIYRVLYNICFGMPQYDYYSNPGNYLLNQTVFEQALDSLQNLCETCSNTADEEFNKLVRKTIGAVGSMLYCYYDGGTRFISRAMYETKFLLDQESIYQVADFFKTKYLLNEDCFLVLLENESNEVLQIPIWDKLTNKYNDAYMVFPLRLFMRGENVRVKRINDDKYKSFKYSPAQLISSIKFSISGDNIVGQVDNSKWEDAAWNL